RRYALDADAGAARRAPGEVTGAHPGIGPRGSSRLHRGAGARRGRSLHAARKRAGTGRGSRAQCARAALPRGREARGTGIVTRRSWLLLAAWCALLAIGIAWIQARLHVSADLRLFMPRPRGEQQRLLVQNIGESPASRLLLVTLEGDQPAVLADISKRLATALATRAEFGLVANGAQAPLAIPESLLPYRYLLTDSFDRHSLDAHSVESALADRAADMAS